MREDISRQVAATAGNARTAKEENLQSHEPIRVCREHMDNLVKAMYAIEQKSKEIGKAVKTLEDIVYQTNPLALEDIVYQANLPTLNASVEAARAGGTGDQRD